MTYNLNTDDLSVIFDHYIQKYSIWCTQQQYDIAFTLKNSGPFLGSNIWWNENPNYFRFCYAFPLSAVSLRILCINQKNQIKLIFGLVKKYSWSYVNIDMSHLRALIFLITNKGVELHDFHVPLKLYNRARLNVLFWV